jgi:hypothetical protein
MISHAVVCEIHPRKNASHELRARTMATSKGMRAMKARKPRA